MAAYYNENDPKAAKWLGELIRRGLIADGDVDDRSIEDVKPSEIAGYDQHHFFAGIGGWSYALRLAGWPDDRPIATGSCPCQPFSVAGRRGGVEDERHLWPAFRWLIAKCGFSIVAGEQVASKDGRSWLAGVRADMETMGYVFGAADLCAAGVGAPHIRQRLWWVGHTIYARPQGYGRPVHKHDPAGWEAEERHRSEAGFWSAYRTFECADGNTRRIEPGTEPLAHGIPARVVRLRGYGNAIVPQVAAEFIMAWQECVSQ